ncbi:phage head-tail joining protein [Oenococcus oeni]|uniref:phage head-tail adapter protein n=1 Tax=Oenococcus oeni TaxID=1247 RepID=UPI001079A159|nr:phage head-tail adapter protein [Oenococcus oeni]AVI94105.1 phage head-tail adapter protein [Oenococcus oeni]SYV99696.1 phage head-tail joining protein [Oenococcus oeni]SYW03873.1 phage head-tail joining protein [Oenococcus oeni]SYW17651.1 phage head-tail joining protein [Oenococcus oeni]VDC14624.1 phage head-tail joining protein [Oenococcus oeni]
MADSDLSSQMESWVNSVEKVAILSVDEQTEINKAGADVGAKILQQDTKDRHYRKRKTGEDVHLADSVLSEANNINGDKDGSSVFGFSADKAYIARFLNDGTKHIQADHFVDDARKEAKEAIEEAKEAEYKKIMKSKGVNF